MRVSTGTAPGRMVYLLGRAVREVLVLTTFRTALLYLAGDHKNHVLVLAAN